MHLTRASVRMWPDDDADAFAAHFAGDTFGFALVVDQEDDCGSIASSFECQRPTHRRITPTSSWSRRVTLTAWSPRRSK